MRDRSISLFWLSCNWTLVQCFIGNSGILNTRYHDYLTGCASTIRTARYDLAEEHASPSSSSSDDNVKIFDNVFSSAAREELHYLTLEHSDRCGVRSSIFHYRDNNYDDNDDTGTFLTPLERALKSFLDKTIDLPTSSSSSPKIQSGKSCQHNDPSHVIVEYWSREEYLNMDTHADIDEQQLLNEGTIRCPDFGHVLYLQVDSTLRGPTCVFPNRHGGWQQQQGEVGGTSLVTVPAVAGRVLRFPGGAMHAVPKPATLWFLDPKEQATVLLEEEEEEDYSGDDEDYDGYEYDSVERSVILFNVWLNTGPLGVSEDVDSKGLLPDGIQLMEDGGDNHGDNNGSNKSMLEVIREQRTAEWDEEYGRGCCDICCEPRNMWKEQKIIVNRGPGYSTDDNELEKIHVSLMGNKARRLYPKSHVSLFVPKNLATALTAQTTPYSFLLSEATEQEELLKKII